MKSQKILILPLLAFLFLWSCETIDPLIEEIQTGILIGNFEAAIERADEAIAADSMNTLAWYYKGVAQGQMAQAFEDPNDRTPHYEEARKTFLEGQRFARMKESLPDEYEDTNEALVSFWAFEHNQGLDYLNEDSLRMEVDDPDMFAIGNFKNATVIQPDSAISYMALSYTEFNMGKVDEAVASHEKYMELASDPNEDDFAFMASLYSMVNDVEKQESILNRGLESYPGSTQLVELLADLYIQTERTDEAIELVRLLIEEDPDNPQLYRVLGTQIYQAVNEINSDISELLEEVFELERDFNRASASEQEAIQEQLDEKVAQLNSLIERSGELTQLAITEMEKVVALDDEDHEAYNILGVIYQNEAANLFDQRNFTIDNERAQELDEQARENLRQAQKYYERAAELEPDEEEYWLALFQVYTTLGMEEEAADAMERAGI